MHKEDWAGGGPPGEDSSEYMTGLIEVLAYVREEHLSKMQQHGAAAAAAAVGGEGGRGGARGGARGGGGGGAGASAAAAAAAAVPSARAAAALGARCLEFFVRHVSLIRTLGEMGKLRLTKDMAELEHAVGAHLTPASTLGAPYRALRALRSFLFLPADQVVGSPQLQDLPRAQVLHLLYAHAPKALATPWQRAGLAPAQYSVWLDKHTEAWPGKMFLATSSNTL